MALALQHQTLAQACDKLRQRYKTAGREEAARIAKFVLDHIEAGGVTDLQVRNTSGLTAGQWTTLKAKMTNMRGNYEAVQTAAGE